MLFRASFVGHKRRSWRGASRATPAQPADKNCSLRAFWYFALEALIDKPPLGPIHLFAHASCLGELEARIIGCLCCAHAPPPRNTHLVLCPRGNARESGARTDGQHCYLDDLLHFVLVNLRGCVSVARKRAHPFDAGSFDAATPRGNYSARPLAAALALLPWSLQSCDKSTDVDRKFRDR